MSHQQNEILREMQYEHCKEEADSMSKQEYRDSLFDADFNLNHIRRNFITLEDLINN